MQREERQRREREREREEKTTGPTAATPPSRLDETFWGGTIQTERAAFEADWGRCHTADGRGVLIALPYSDFMPCTLREKMFSLLKAMECANPGWNLCLRHPTSLRVSVSPCLYASLCLFLSGSLSLCSSTEEVSLSCRHCSQSVDKATDFHSTL